MELPRDFSNHLADGGLIAAAVLAVLLVALSTYGRRASHPALRIFVWGASIVFLPLTSSIISTLLRRSGEKKEDGSPPPQGSKNSDVQSMWTLLLWIALSLIIKGNADNAAASTASAASPSASDAIMDGQKFRPPWENLFQFAWLGVLIVQCIPVADWLGAVNKAIFIAFCVLGFAKMVLNTVAFWSAGGSFALGKNARLVAGYMAQLVEGGKEEGHGRVPRYIVMGERKELVEENPHGYRVKRAVMEDGFSSALVTLDRVWLLSSEHGHGLLADRRELRDLCLSFSLFKSLRRRLSGYPLAEVGSANALDFVLRGMDAAGAGAGDADRLFRVLIDELWFASDFYYSSLPLCSFSMWFAVLNHLFSVLIIAGAVAVGVIYQVKRVVVFGERPFYYIISFALLLAVVIVEAWEVVAGVCSNWTKMALLGHYVRRESLWRRSRCANAALAAVLRFRSARRWRDKIGQNSVLEPRLFTRRSGLLSEQIYGRAGLMRSVNVSPAVKDAMLRSLRSIYGRMDKGSTAARRVGGKVDWAWYGSHKSLAPDGDGSSTTEYILAWHVATSLFEMRYPHAAAADANTIAACHLSNYCAYLAAAAPELLPDSAAWTERRFREVSDDARAALGQDGGAGAASESTAQQRYAQAARALAAGSRDAVLRRGAEIGRRLVEQYEEDEASAWLFLADFWSETVLFVAPSENVKGHVVAMARGGEFLTLVWALLLHAGVTTRPETPGSVTAIP